MNGPLREDDVLACTHRCSPELEVRDRTSADAMGGWVDIVLRQLFSNPRVLRQKLHRPRNGCSRGFVTRENHRDDFIRERLCAEWASPEIGSGFEVCEEVFRGWPPSIA